MKMPIDTDKVQQNIEKTHNANKNSRKITTKEKIYFKKTKNNKTFVNEVMTFCLDLINALVFIVIVWS